ncbi:hypothetical protein B0T26DRAFT_681221 [Lasiosphaeria miniovina]|uniref:Uncharacterized protein n=1 Tax=Lasiosphaeria miniovina TaxID=1954250 RepID=A0AA39ZTV1_9PEZI|nr:uncharacterized protein B0T26DRAFT_681221 [Lasiosphaeria miniovina]KAK0703562.1 hypothetical protein B0T26DRAFT_681221 [Lasiosphaeria miniovina]
MGLLCPHLCEDRLSDLGSTTVAARVSVSIYSNYRKWLEKLSPNEIGGNYIDPETAVLCVIWTPRRVLKPSPFPGQSGTVVLELDSQMLRAAVIEHKGKHTRCTAECVAKEVDCEHGEPALHKFRDGIRPDQLQRLEKALVSQQLFTGDVNVEKPEYATRNEFLFQVLGSMFVRTQKISALTLASTPKNDLKHPVFGK